MKHFAIKMLLLSFLCISIRFNATAIDNVVIAFLKEQPTQKIQNCTGEDLMNLLTDESLKFIESIDCSNIKLENRISGITLETKIKGGPVSFIKINFKATTLLNCIRINSFGNTRDNPTPIDLQYNDTPYSNKVFGENRDTYNNGTSEEILTAIKKDNLAVPSITGDLISPAVPLHNITLILPSEYNENRLQFYGFKIYYDGIVDESDIETAVTELPAENVEKSIEYFDMMGRRLPEVPAKGIYIRKCGSNVEKIAASGK